MNDPMDQLDQYLTDKYIFDEEGNLTRPTSYKQWIEFNSKIKNKIVQQTWVGRFWISTVFLGSNHRFGHDGTFSGPPILWETLVFDRQHKGHEWSDIDGDRYCSLEDATSGHRKFIDKVKTWDQTKTREAYADE